MRFLESSPESPHITLKVIQGIQPAENHSPFAQIDAMYLYIFSQARNLDNLKTIFALHFISSAYNFLYENSRNLLNDFVPATCDVTVVESLISAVVSIVRLENKTDDIQLIFYHASLGDFLQDEARSGVHFVNVHTTRIWLNIGLLGCVQTTARWVCLTLHYEVPSLPRGRTYPCYKRYKLLIKLQLQVLKLVCKKITPPDFQ